MPLCKPKPITNIYLYTAWFMKLPQFVKWLCTFVCSIVQVNLRKALGIHSTLPMTHFVVSMRSVWSAWPLLHCRAPGNLGTAWHRLTMDVSPHSANTRFSFVNSISGSPSGYTCAIGSVSLIPGPCLQHCELQIEHFESIQSGITHILAL